MTVPRELPMAAPEPEPVAVVGAAADRYRVEGMDCAGCARTVEKAVAALDGVRTAEVRFGTGTLLVDGDVDPARVRAVVARAGYRVAADRETGAWRRDPRSVSTVLSVLVLLAAVTADVAGVTATAGYVAALAIGGWPVIRSAAQALRRRALDMNVLMALAAVGAVGIGAYAEGAWVLVLFAVGTTLEAYAFDRSRRSVGDLMDLTPPTAAVLDGSHEQLVPVEEVVPGSLVLVRPGERVPLDGEVVTGGSSVDQSPVTGESVPVEKASGDAVFAGTLNAEGALTLRVTRGAGDSTLARVAALVEQAQGSKAPSERFVDRFAAVYTPLVFVAALLLALVPPLLGGDLGTWLYRALALLIVACPCSLVISVPVAVVSAVGRAARDGVLIKGGQALEDLAQVRAVALDKTGTITAGTPELVSVRTLPGGGPARGASGDLASVRDDPAGGAEDPDAALALAAALEHGSEHPLAQAVVRAARERGLAMPAAGDFRAFPGRGVEATVDGRRLWAGGPRLARERLGVGADAILAGPHRDGRTAIVVGEADRALAVLGLADRPRPEAAEAVGALRAAGVDTVVMLTGDHERVAAATGAATGVDTVRSGLLPQDKLDAVRALVAEHGAVAMVGDGINDTPALAAATVGVAMGAAGTDAALETADVALMGDDLTRLPDAVAGARRARRVMRQNVLASLLVKAVFVALAPFGLVTLVVAVAADMGMSLLVTLNGLRLLRRGAHDA